MSAADCSFDAFISYRRADGRKIAERLRRRLTTYRLPRPLQPSYGRRLAIYLDTIYEKADDDFFENTIKPALTAARFLVIVITPSVFEREPNGSPNWLFREVEHFRSLPQGWAWVTTVTRAELSRLDLPITGVSALAIGTDQLFAKLVLGRGGRLHAVLPFADLERTFSPPDVAQYHELLAQGSSEVLHTAGSDEDAFMAAGIRVVDLSGLMIAVWDGQPARGKGGTADIVAYARHCRRALVHLNPTLHIVERIAGGRA